MHVHIPDHKWTFEAGSARAELEINGCMVHVNAVEVGFEPGGMFTIDPDYQETLDLYCRAVGEPPSTISLNGGRYWLTFQAFADTHNG